MVNTTLSLKKGLSLFCILKSYFVFGFKLFASNISSPEPFVLASFTILGIFLSNSNNLNGTSLNGLSSVVTTLTTSLSNVTSFSFSKLDIFSFTNNVSISSSVLASCNTINPSRFFTFTNLSVKV